MAIGSGGENKDKDKDRDKAKRDGNAPGVPVSAYPDSAQTRRHGAPVSRGAAPGPARDSPTGCRTITGNGSILRMYSGQKRGSEVPARGRARRARNSAS
ncbi:MULTISPECIES: hypothetical protein [Cupriavidus]